MQPEPISEPVGKPPYNDLGLGVLTANGSHNCGALGGGSRVGHDFHHARMLGTAKGRSWRRRDGGDEEDRRVVH